ncbi:hypothetical protein [Miltoncostaea oceani]|jgi:hypothetical protein|uniref:hypothetical protein n=1 Tax=Miltoncostaea oceani TaxID=2843216 RepID=UPI001C3E61EF|nr:hypothetical protein [Miltoncostaea oceani]
MRSTTSSQGQLILFPGAPTPATPTARPRRAGPAERKAAQLDRMAAEAEREVSEAWRAGDMPGARAAHDRARGARRAAQLLRAGPAGVAEVIGGHHEAA